ncbi:MAG: hypothetical protein GY809_23160 [Planctomycetes bacterium]|nr:hypothetical protein [Planctomycetota bacterium]
MVKAHINHTKAAKVGDATHVKGGIERVGKTRGTVEVQFNGR